MSKQNTNGKPLLKFAVKEKRKKMTVEMPEKLFNQVEAYVRYAQSSHEQEIVIDETEVVNCCLKEVLGRDRKFQDWYGSQSFAATSA